MTTPQINAQNPWPWLDPYTEDGSGAFFNGRDDDTEQLAQLVTTKPATVLFGKSGLGKTSLLQAGLFRRLREAGLLPVLVRLAHGSDAPLAAAQLQARLQQECEIWGYAPPGNANLAIGLATPADRFWLNLHTLPLGLKHGNGQVAQPVFVLDQFEEIFTRGATDAKATQVTLGALGNLIENRIPAALQVAIQADEDLLDQLHLDAQPYRVLLSLREDFLPDLERWADRIPRLGPNRYRLLPMREDQAMEATLKTGGSLLTETAARQIVQFVGGQMDGGAATKFNTPDGTPAQLSELRVEPALLSLLCSGLNQDRQNNLAAHIDASNLDQRGGQIIEHFYDDAIHNLPSNVVTWIEDSLITPDGIRMAYPVQSALQQKHISKAEIDTLVNGRLLRKETFATGGDRVELVHDRLAAVARQRRENRQQVLEQQRLQAQAVELEHRAQAETVRREQAEQMSAELGRSRSKFQSMFYGVLFALVMALGLAWYAWLAESRATSSAREATILRLVSQSSAMTHGQLDGGTTRGWMQLLAAHRMVDATRSFQSAITFGELGSEVGRNSSLKRLYESSSEVIRVAFSPDGKKIASTHVDKSIRLWDSTTGNAIGDPLDGQTEMVSIAFSPDGRRLVTGSVDRMVRIWDVASGMLIGKPLIGHESWVWGVRFSANGTNILSIGGPEIFGGSREHSIRTWDASSGAAVGKPLVWLSDSAIAYLDVSPDGRRIAYAGEDNSVRQFDTVTGARVGNPMKGHTDAVNAVTFSFDGLRIASVSKDKTLRLWNAVTGEAIGKPMNGHTQSVFAVAISPDGLKIASAGDDKTIRQWDAKTGMQLGDPIESHLGRVGFLAFSPDGGSLVSGSFDKTLRLWDATGSLSMYKKLEGHTSSVNSLAFSRDGKSIVSAGDDGTVRLWDATGVLTVEKKKFAGHRGRVKSVAISPDSRWIVAGGANGLFGPKDFNVKIWDISNGALTGTLVGHKEAVSSVAFSPDGRRIVSGSWDSTLRIWDAVTGEVIGNPITGHSDGVTSVAISPDGKRVVSGSNDKTVRLWSLPNGAAIGKPLTGHADSVTCVAISPDGKRIVTGGHDKTLRFWGADDGNAIGKPLKGHSNVIRTVAFSPDGRHIVSGGDDETVRIWDAATGTAIGKPLNGQTGGVNSVAFSTDGRRVVSGSSGDKTIRIWDVFESWADALCAKLPRNMSKAEWREWVSPDIPYVKQCPNLPVPPDAPSK